MKNLQKLIEEIVLCEVKYGIPISNSKKMAQLICLGGKEHGMVITVTQMNPGRVVSGQGMSRVL
jgi:hypothetical protein